MDDRPLNILSLCTGYGGLDLGLELALPDSRVVCHVEREAAAAGILGARMGQGLLAPAPVWSDLRTFDGRPWRGVVDCVTAGYPCQPFSHAGRRGGHDDPRHLWPQVARVIQESEPGIVWLENVPGHLSLGAETVLLHLRVLGYRATAGLFSAEEAGAPHRRVRMFILGVGDSQGLALGVHAGQRRPGAGAPGAHEAGGAVGDAQRAREGGRGAHRGPGGAHHVPLWPPGPGAVDEWARLVAQRPDLAPAVEPGVRGVAHGRPGRLDRLRALGNGVVPVVAAHAFVALWACLREEELKPKEG